MCVKSKVKVGFLTVDMSVFSYMPLNGCCFSIISFQLGTPSMRYMSVAYNKLQVKPVCKLKRLLFNIECYWEFFSGITPLLIIISVYFCFPVTLFSKERL
jgi:hypothetical protein